MCREPNDDVFTFQSTTESRRIRAWDRAPKSPFANRHRGRKLWKRYELRAKEAAHEGQAEPVTELGVLNDLSTNKVIKRMRVKETSFGSGEEGEQRPTRYITTLQDTAPGTPRSWSCFILLCKNLTDTRYGQGNMQSEKVCDYRFTEPLNSRVQMIQSRTPKPLQRFCPIQTEITKR